ncbi:phosphoribosyltransferase family protein [Leifsonia sp. C5G2]|uniref:phosphoribosyltransferase family protein n=1 Tax=Leifsonia sp. C5G2 TaxID=2735269 RepID=UPI00201C8A25|nr:phosphoribosyltransferase family protein [Leifsonia sp. C5G2]
MYADRIEAGRELADSLQFLAVHDPVVLGLPRGGVPVADEVAKALHAPLDVIVVRKLGVPYQPELAMGAIGEGGVRVVDDDVVRMAGLTDADLAEVEHRERAELERRVRPFRGDRERVSLAGRTVIIVDDGIATGSTARAACRVARALGASRVVVAAPVGPAEAASRLIPDADDVVCLEEPVPYFAVGQAYRDFTQTTDDEVASVLARAALRPTGAPADLDPEVEIPAGRVTLAGSLAVPDQATGLVLFAHGSGSSRHSPRNRFVAAVLNARGIATLLLDLLTPGEEHDRRLVFDIELLAERLGFATRWARQDETTAGLPLAYFGASTGAGAALTAAAQEQEGVVAVVSRGGRPDLAGAGALERVTAPTLLIVGGNDPEVLDLNRLALSRMRCPTRLEVVPDAGHLFEEPGALETVAQLAAGWFEQHLPTADRLAAG